jgi:transposase
MARKIDFTPEQLEMAKDLRDNHNNEREYRAAIAVLLIEEQGLSREAVAQTFGIDVKTVHADLKRIRNPDSVSPGVWGGGNNHLMTFEEETEFLAEFTESSETGKLITMPKLHHEYNLRVGKITPKSTFYRLLKRHNWQKVLPDTGHSKGDLKLQEDFKKKLCRWKWQRS